MHVRIYWQIHAFITHTFKQSERKNRGLMEDDPQGSGLKRDKITFVNTPGSCWKASFLNVKLSGET